MGDDEEKVNDSRYDLLCARVIASFPKLGDGKLVKAFAEEATKELIMRFLDEDDCRCLVVPESLKVDVTIPSKLGKGKILLFVKLGGDKLDSEKMSSQIVVAEIGGATPFEHLELLANEVFLPILSNPQNQAKWGEVPTREIMDRFHNFLSSTTILCGQIKGETRLPMPPIDLSGGPSTGKNRISLLEGAIITWTKQIRSVLKQDPESQLKLGMHPTPDFEIDFWKTKAGNLNSIYEQLQGPKIRRVLRALDNSKSTYCATFTRLCKEVFTARLEANDNTKYLRTLEYWFGKLNTEDDFPKTMELFKPVLHIILLIWKNSKHYNTPNRLVVLMREICNSLIAQATKYVSGEQIFNMIEAKEAGNAVTMLKTTLHVCGTFKSTYIDYKTTANAECPLNPWKMQNNALFMRLDSFLERCHDILDLTQTIVQFSKLANIEVGGTKGSTLTSSIKQIYDDFLQTVAKFKAVPYDIMDVGAKTFDDDFYDFRCSIKELERRLGAVVSLAFDDCTTVYGRFKLLDSFEGLLERPIIQDELEKKYVNLVQAYGLDLKIVQELFLSYRDTCPISCNLPPIAGALTWCRGLVSRIEIAYVKLNLLDKSILDREEAKEVNKVYSTIMASLKEFETQKIEEWGREVELSSHAKLKLPLLVRNADTKHLVVNFDPALVRLLREVKYFLLLGLSVPTTALEIYQQVTTFRDWTGRLDMVTSKNNEVLDLLHPVERPLVTSHLTKFDAAIEKGLLTLNWKSQAVREFIDDTERTVEDLYSTVKAMKNQLAEVTEELRKHNISMLTRKPKPMPRDEFDKDYKTAIKEKYAEIKESGKHIHGHVKETNKVLKAAAASPEWLAYVYFINNVVVDGLAKIVYTSLEDLFNQIDPETISKNETLPMIEIKLDLVSVRTTEGRVDEVQFIPCLESNNGKGMSDLINSWIGSFFNVATQFKRLDNNGDGSYLREIHNDYGVKMMMSMISVTLEENENKCRDIKKQYDELSYLWLTNMEDAFAEFQKEAVVELMNADGEGLDAYILDLPKYEEAIVKYQTIRESITHLPASIDVAWVRINADPARGQLINWANKWVALFKDHLIDTLSTELGNLESFIKKTSVGLDIAVEENNEDKGPLLEVMDNIRGVRLTTEKTKGLFKPLGQILVALKSFGVDVVNGVPKIGDITAQDYLDSAPLAWESVEKKMFRKKEDILPLQLSEAEILKDHKKQIDLDIRAFRGDFRNNAPFTFSGAASDAYKILDEHAGKLVAMEKITKDLNQKEDLFELTITKYVETNETRNDIKLLKYVWDMKALVLGTFEAWNETSWNDIEVDPWSGVTNSLMKNLRNMGNETPIVKGWKVYRDIEEEIKNMQSVLDKVQGLHSPAMRERHWKELARVCKVKTIEPHDPKFSFESVVKLKLYEHGDDIDEITDTASKEQKIERKLGDIEKIWNLLVMDYVPFKDDENAICLIRPSEEVIENLEGGALELGGMIGMGKFVDYFRDRVEGWQQNLGLIEDVIKVWSNVSRAWASLQSIFMESPDIRTSLPEDTKVFEGLNGEFEELMKSAVEEENVLRVCTVDGRYDVLMSIQARLDKCQKSLNDYLDQKKKIFPRFYFVSNVALLDMLANGTNPPRIMKYLGDCFDALNQLVFVKNEDGTDNIKRANEMIAKDGERVLLIEEFALEGEVERYLTNLTEAMRNTLKEKMAVGYRTATWDQDNPREFWLNDLAAQVVVTTTQMYWTEESEAALDEIAGGQEDAVKKYYELCDKRLKDLIRRVLGKLERNLRTKIITIITLDVHARDVIEKLVFEKIEDKEAFAWAQQLRFYWKNEQTEIRICDYVTKYFYEWIGNTGRLVITPLTDRCYVTLTMGLRLFLGGAPAGPAGTGKTETTKDLARALALPCYVFNCSDQMNYQTMADIFRGLAQVGCWGCFDEFNRISIEVLSVVATQVKAVQDCVKKFALPANRDPDYQHLPAGLPPIKVGEFFFEGDTISLTPTCGFFITMNPGYAGRTELPENLKVLFRSCAMIRPDLKLICENMLMSEGFELARSLSVKFVTLYELSSELLSKQAHYDWGLRAVKSVLRVAGALKRGEPDKGEEELLMRALRDFNTPKIPAIDTPIFLRLIADLFMGMEVETQVNEDLKKIVSVVAVEEKLQPEEKFVLKVLQFQELLDVRHSVMLLGPTGSGKSCIWRTLAASHNWDTAEGKYKAKKTCIYEPVNPKAVTGDELYGFMTLAKDWKDGVLSIIMRGMAKNIAEQGFHEFQTYKWVVLDGDIDAIWIESMNTVMDDNKVLTLVSNERIPLSAAMRMVFEINSLKNATPATVSRAGILYINEQDVGWEPFVKSYWNKRVTDGIDPNGQERQLIMGLYEKYIDNMVTATSRDFKECTPIYLLNKVSTLTYLMDSFIEAVPFDDRKNLEIMDNLFCFAMMWAFGGVMIEGQTAADDSRKKFNEQTMTPQLFNGRFPKDHPCFDYFYDIEDNTWKEWHDKVPEYTPVPIGGQPGETPFSELFVATSDTVRMTYLMSCLAKKGRHVMLVGSGSGKTSVVSEYIGGLDKQVDGFISTSINMSYFTDSKSLQADLELNIDKRSGRRYGPPASTRLIVFIDDMNLPYIEIYGI
jgi:dynein heavy chain